MKGLDYNIAIAILFPFYVAAEIPSNIIMKRFRLSYWFTIIVVTWGLVMTCMGLVQNFGGLLACRVVLGLAEGGLFPGIGFYITTWYRRHECGYRIALFFSAATIAGAFGGSLAYGIANMSGVGNKSGWASSSPPFSDSEAEYAERCFSSCFGGGVKLCSSLALWLIFRYSAPPISTRMPC